MFGLPAHRPYERAMNETLARAEGHVDEATHVEGPLDPDALATRAFYFAMTLVVLFLAACVFLPLLMAA